MTLICLLLGPLVAGAALSGDRWLLVMILQAPACLIGATRVLDRPQGLTVSTLEAEQESHDRLRRDPLTGLLNMTGLFEPFSDRSEHGPEDLTLFYLDLDAFKPMNDQFGHQAGDDVLKAVAKRLSSGTRAADAVARLGGDEFVIVARGISPAGAERYAHGIISDVAGQPYALDGSRSVHIGISVGFACSPDDGCAREELALKADAALYEAKAAGKGVHRRFCQGRTGFERRWRGCREHRRVRKQWAIDWMPPMQPREPASAAGARRNWAPLLYRKDRVMPGLEEPG